ncbi:hypothetical protein LJR225_002920 [Phenylobacterium sp. LjRoot225]|uniref:hypothetical protein n=1 Tax=Phenylobacterium sp. LjRoot225 TaxID=3342285 RepID=UPI003ECDB8B3
MLAITRRNVVLGAAGGLTPFASVATAQVRDGPLAELAVGLEREIAGLAAAPEEALGGVQALLRSAAGAGAFDRWRRSPPAESHKIEVLRSGGLGRSWKVQLFGIPEGRSHPPHCHENLASCLVVLDGRLRVREYERLRARETEAAALLRGVFDDRLGPGEGMVTAEDYRNAHWFGAVGGRALAVNFKASGHFRRELFRLRNRRYLDPSGGRRGEFWAPFISPAEARARFAGAPL